MSTGTVKAHTSFPENTAKLLHQMVASWALSEILKSTHQQLALWQSNLIAHPSLPGPESTSALTITTSPSLLPILFANQMTDFREALGSGCPPHCSPTIKATVVFRQQHTFLLRRETGQTNKSLVSTVHTGVNKWMDRWANPGSHEPEKGSVKESDMLRSLCVFCWD